jgi:PrtD family type I secretion system ABC transporter
MENPATELADALRACRRATIFLMAFSLGINVLSLASPLYMMQLYDRVVAGRSIDTLIMLTLIFAFAIGTLAVLDVMRTQILTRVGIWLDDRLGPSTIGVGLRLALNGGQARAGEAVRDLATLRNFLSGPTINPLLDAPWAPLFLAMLFLLHPTLGVVGLISAFLLFSLAVLNEVVSRKPLQQAAGANARSMRSLDAAFRNAEVIEALGMRDNIVRWWRRESRPAKAAQNEAARNSGVVQGLSRFTRLFVQSMIMGVGAWLVIDGQATPGVMFGSSFLIARCLAPVENAIGTWRSVVAARLSHRRLRALMTAAPATPAGMKLPRPEGLVTVERAVYTPPGSATPILRGVSFALQPGEMLGIIGPSASGKTTLARLLVGAWRPSSGSVRIDGADIAVWLASDGAEHIGYLPQDVELFGGSVRDNIARLGEAEPDKIIAAARLAGLHDMIMRFPNGYDTEIGEDGVKLSGGQRQRVALARAIFGEPRVVVLDEPNSSLDSEGEAALIDAIARLKAGGTTLLVIAHRPNIVQHADKILILRNGMVESFGPRAEVLARLSAAAVIGPSRTPVAAELKQQA